LGWSLLAFMIFAIVLFKRDQRWNRIPLSILILLVWMLIRTWQRPVSLRETEVFFSWLQPFLLFVAGRLWCSSDRAFRFDVLGRWLLVSGFLQAGYMIFQYSGVDPLFGETISAFDYKPARMIGTIGYQNQAVDFIGVTCAGIWLTFRKRPVQWMALFVVGVVIALTANRGGFIAFLAAITAVCLYWFLVNRPTDPIPFNLEQGLRLAGLCLLCGIGLTFFPEFHERFGSLLHHVDQNVAVQSRLWMHRVALNLWASAPLQGVGAGGFAYNFLTVLAEKVPALKTHGVLVQLVFTREAHFDLLQFAAEFGLIGIGGLFWVVKDGCRAFRDLQGKENEMCRQALLWVAVYMGVSSLFTFSWQSASAGPAAGFLLGLLLPVSSTHICLKGRTLHWMFPFILTGISFVYYLGLTIWDIRTPWLISQSQAEKAVEEVPMIYHRYRAFIGGALAQEGDLEGGQKTLEEAQTGYLDLLVWNNRANIYMQQGKWEGAIRLYRQWSETGIMHSEALLNLSIAYEKSGAYLQAAETLYQHMNLWPPEDFERIQRASVMFFQAGEWGQARHVLNRYYGVWRDLPKGQQARLWNLRGATYMKEAEWGKAQESFKTAIEFDPTLKSAGLNLQQVRSRL
jgi:Flp pilus assembly protein TadD